MENAPSIINALEKAYMNGQIGGEVSIVLSDASTNNTIWKTSIRHDGGIDHLKMLKVTQYLTDRINELQWILNNKCPPKISIQIIVKPASHAYLLWRNDNYAIAQLPRYINGQHPDQATDIRVRNILVINALDEFITSNCRNMHVNFAILYKAVTSIMFENNKIYKDNHSIIKIYDKDISC